MARYIEMIHCEQKGVFFFVSGLMENSIFLSA
jgi:hypothetical protein